VTIIFGMKSRVGILGEALGVFEKHDIDLSHVESRPAMDRDAGADYDFFVTVNGAFKRDALLKDLETLSVSVTVLDENADSEDPNWFPRKISELDLFATRVLDAGRDLNSDHPGFTDPVYRERRRYFADTALEYKHGTKIPHVTYTEAETKTWGVVFNKLKDLYPTHACEQYNKYFPMMEQFCGYRADNIPQLEEVSNFLQSCTGFRLRPVAGLLSSRDFLAGLAFRVFHSTQYIRHSSKPLYTPEPDVCHELLGHAPLFADKDFAEFSQEIGLASLGASDDEIKRLATCYWFTIEFGLCRENGKIKAFGAGLLSSFGELTYCLTDKPELKPFDPPITGLQEYPVTEYQPVYFVADSFESAKEKMRDFASKLKRPFQVRYNPYTSGIELLERNQELVNLAHSIKSDMAVLMTALTRRAAVN